MTDDNENTSFEIYIKPRWAGAFLLLFGVWLTSACAFIIVSALNWSKLPDSAWILLVSIPVKLALGASCYLSLARGASLLFGADEEGEGEI